MPDVPEVLSLLLALFAGAGLASACGFRALLPLLVLGALARNGSASLAPSFEWLGSSPVLGVLLVLAFVESSSLRLRERAGALPAILTGTVSTAALLADLSLLPGLGLGLVVGGGVAAGVRTATAELSGVATRGPAGEVLLSVLVSGLSLYAPISAPMIVVALLVGGFHLRRERRRQTA